MAIVYGVQRKRGVGATPAVKVAPTILVWGLIQGKCTENTEGVRVARELCFRRLLVTYSAHNLAKFFSTIKKKINKNVVHSTNNVIPQ